MKKTRRKFSSGFKARVAIEALKERLADDLTADEEEDLKERIAARETQQKRKWNQLARSVDVYGAINLRTDGQRIVMAQKLEKKRGSSEWDIYQLEKGTGGRLLYLSKYEKE